MVVRYIKKKVKEVSWKIEKKSLVKKSSFKKQQKEKIYNKLVIIIID